MFKPFDKKPKWTPAVRARVKKRFLGLGITTCELRYDGCAVNNFLGFAHRMKQRKIETPEEIETVILACGNCHEIIEKLPAEEMFRAVTETIKRRDI